MAYIYNLKLCLIVMASLSLNNTVMAILAVAIGLVLIGSLLSPIALDVIAQMTELGGDAITWAKLVSVTVVISLLGLVIVAIRNFTGGR